MGVWLDRLDVTIAVNKSIPSTEVIPKNTRPASLLVTATTGSAQDCHAHSRVDPIKALVHNMYETLKKFGPASLFLVALACGFVLGSSWKKTRDANDIRLGAMFPARLAQRTLRDIRILNLLHAHDYAMTETLLKLDLQDNYSALITLSNVIELNDLQKNAIAQAQTFWKDNGGGP